MQLLGPIYGYLNVESWDDVTEESEIRSQCSWVRTQRDLAFTYDIIGMDPEVAAGGIMQIFSDRQDMLIGMGVRIVKHHERQAGNLWVDSQQAVMLCYSYGAVLSKCMEYFFDIDGKSTQIFRQQHMKCMLEDGKIESLDKLAVFVADMRDYEFPLPPAESLLHVLKRTLLYAGPENDLTSEYGWPDYMFKAVARILDDPAPILPKPLPPSENYGPFI